MRKNPLPLSIICLTVISLTACTQPSETIKVNSESSSSASSSQPLVDQTDAICVLYKPLNKSSTDTGFELDDIYSTRPSMGVFLGGNSLVIVNQGKESVVFDEANAGRRYFLDVKSGDLSIRNPKTGEVLNSGKCNLKVTLTAEQRAMFKQAFDGCISESQKPNPTNLLNDPILMPQNEVDKFNANSKLYYQNISCSLSNTLDPSLGYGRQLEFASIFDQNPVIWPPCSSFRTLRVINQNRSSLVFEEENNPIQYAIDLKNKQLTMENMNPFQTHAQNIINTGVCKFYQSKQPTKQEVMQEFSGTGSSSLK